MQQMHYRSNQKSRIMRRFPSIMIKLALVAILLVSTTASLGMGQSDSSDFATEVRTLTQEAIHQLTIAIRLSLIAPQTPSLNDMKFNAGRILNTLVGEESEHFDRGYGLPLNADTGGVIPRLARIRTLLAPHAENDARVRNWLNALENIQFFSEVAREEMLFVLEQTNDRPARISLRKTIAFLTATRGNSDDPLSEGGARALERDIGRDE